MAETPNYQLYISLNHIKPPIWRRISVPSGLLLPDLHIVIQICMGWTNAHLHQFVKDSVFYAEPSPFDDFPLTDYRKMPVRDLLQAEGDHITYEYDLGDGWEHEVRLETIFPPGEGPDKPACLAGARACPPEDSGGPWRYPHLLHVLADPHHEEHEDMLGWVEEGFDPEEFDIQAVNAFLRRRKFKVAR
ncbi:MAG: plasmid pRiA4b ORF-3 family protein [Bacteroidetes bacterium]|nr:MAG: plasmid pRiA4b ORF-3 family protein [Bacteroidota bacterium]